MNTPTLSILTPAIWTRQDQCRQLADDISYQISNLGPNCPVEHLVLFDNRTRSVGLKRQALLDSARGKYIAFCDDDDFISRDYVKRLLDAAATNADVITFKQQATINGLVGHIHFTASTAVDEPWQEGHTAKRPPWHVCAWKRELVAHCKFTDKNYGEDLDWCRQARQEIEVASHIDAVLHYYRHDSRTTAAPMPA